MICLITAKRENFKSGVGVFIYEGEKRFRDMRRKFSCNNFSNNNSGFLTLSMLLCNHGVLEKVFSLTRGESLNPCYNQNEKVYFQSVKGYCVR